LDASVNGEPLEALMKQSKRDDDKSKSAARCK